MTAPDDFTMPGDPTDDEIRAATLDGVRRAGCDCDCVIELTERVALDVPGIGVVGTMMPNVYHDPTCTLLLIQSAPNN